MFLNREPVNTEEAKKSKTQRTYEKMKMSQFVLHINDNQHDINSELEFDKDFDSNSDPNGDSVSLFN